MQMRVADFLVKPVPPVELVRGLRPRRQRRRPIAEATEAQIFTFLPAVGGAGVTTLAVQTAMLLLNSGARGKTSTCLVDLDFQHGACADYLDIEPRLNLGEIEPRPERLDRQLLEVMLSQHPSGLAVVAAPNRPGGNALVRSRRRHAAARSGVVEFRLCGVRHAAHLVLLDRQRAARLEQAFHRQRNDGAGPAPRQATRRTRSASGSARVRSRRSSINRFEQKMFSPGLRRSDIEQAIGDAFFACVPNDYALVREAIDRGVPLDEVKPGNKITTQLKKLILPQTAGKAAKAAAARRQRSSSSSWARS